MNYSHKDLRKYAANPLHASLARWQQSPVAFDTLCIQAERRCNRVSWHFSGDPMASNAEALEYTTDAIAKLKRVADELRARISEGNP